MLQRLFFLSIFSNRQFQIECIMSQDDPVVVLTNARNKATKGEIDEALKLYQKAVSISEKNGDKRTKAVAFGEIGRIKVDRGELDHALGLHLFASQLYDELDDPRSKTMTKGEVAKIMVHKGHINEGLQLHSEVLEVCKMVGDQQGIAMSLGEIAQIQVSLGKVDEGIKLHKEALEIFEEIGDLASKAITLWDLSKIVLPKGDEKGIDYLLESYRILKDPDRLEGISFVGLDLGTLLCHAGNAKDGLEILDRSREGFKKLGMKDMLTHVEQAIQKFSC